MSRSYKKHKFAAWCGGDRAQCIWRTSSHRANRRKHHEQLLYEARYGIGDIVLKLLPETGGDEWDSPRDGSMRYHPDWDPKNFRK